MQPSLQHCCSGRQVRPQPFSGGCGFFVVLVLIFREGVRQLELRDVTRELLKAVEVESGFSAHVREEPGLTTLATVRMARLPLPAHVISYRPDGKRFMDYLVCYQCGFVLRHYEAPAEARGVVVAAAAGERAVREALGELAGLALVAEQSELARIFLGGLITHVRSAPVGLRVAAWLSEYYPALQEQQREVVALELAEAKETLHAQYREITPEAVYRPMQVINAAHALFWAERLGRRELAAPYRVAGYDVGGEALLKLWGEIPVGPAYDRALIDAWGAHLGILGWYDWALL